jgi:hypothetical protein
MRPAEGRPEAAKQVYLSPYVHLFGFAQTFPPCPEFICKLYFPFLQRNIPPKAFSVKNYVAIPVTLPSISLGSRTKLTKQSFVRYLTEGCGRSFFSQPSETLPQISRRPRARLEIRPQSDWSEVAKAPRQTRAAYPSRSSSSTTFPYSEIARASRSSVSCRTGKRGCSARAHMFSPDGLPPSREKCQPKFVKMSAVS